MPHCVGDKSETKGENGNVMAKVTYPISWQTMLECDSVMLCQPPCYASYNVISKDTVSPQSKNFPTGNSMVLLLTFFPSVLNFFVRVKHGQSLKTQLILQD
jgi:hypothetical protein